VELTNIFESAFTILKLSLLKEESRSHSPIICYVIYTLLSCFEVSVLAEAKLSLSSSSHYLLFRSTFY